VTEIRWAPLPTDVAVQTWEDDGHTIIVINGTLPPARQHAALRATLREIRTRRGRPRPRARRPQFALQ